MRRACWIAMFSFCAPLLAQQMKLYERGVIINIQEDTQTSFYQGTSHADYFENYWVRVGDVVYKGWCRDRLIHGCNIGFTIGDNVDVRFDKSSMFLKRSNGKEQKTTVEKQIRVAPGTSDALSEAMAGLPSNSGRRSEPALGGTAQEGSGKLTINSVPESAEIAVDDSFIGNSPATTRLSAGNHTITVRSDGFKPWTRQIRVLPDSELTLNATLENGVPEETTLAGRSAAIRQATGQPTSAGNNSLENLPRLWTFPNSHTNVEIEIRGDYLYEHEEIVMRDGRRRGEDCETKKDGDRWVGKCHEKIWPLQGGETPECSWELDEVITSVSPLQIAGESQESHPPERGRLCPTPAKSMVKFVNVPKN